jgi:DNA-binding IclR family transcriptional regulator
MRAGQRDLNAGGAWSEQPDLVDRVQEEGGHVAGGSAGQSVLSRVLDVLESFDQENPTLTVAQIARRGGLTPPTAHRIVGELLALGLLERGPERTVRIGLRFWEIASSAPRALGLREIAMPAMEDLHAITRQHTQLSVREGTEALVIERLSHRGAVTNFSRVGRRVPLHASSGGLVLLAYSPHPLQEQLLASPLRQYTSNTPVHPAQLREILAGIRERGYVVCDRYISDDSMGIAVPVRNPAGEPVAALTVVVPASTAQPLTHINALTVTARAITRAMAQPRQPPWHELPPVPRRGGNRRPAQPDS